MDAFSRSVNFLDDQEIGLEQLGRTESYDNPWTPVSEDDVGWRCDICEIASFLIQSSTTNSNSGCESSFSDFGSEKLSSPHLLQIGSTSNWNCCGMLAKADAMEFDLHLGYETIEIKRKRRNRINLTMIAQRNIVDLSVRK